LRALALQAALSLRHARRKNRQQNVAVMRLTERILQLCKALRDFLKGRIDRVEAFQCVAQPLARDPKVVKALPVSPFQARGQIPSFTRAQLNNTSDDVAHVADAVEVDWLRFHCEGTTE
jgi:hypothetical protein